MGNLSRRRFLRAGADCAVIGSSAVLLSPTGSPAQVDGTAAPVHFLHDGVGLSPVEYAELLVKLAHSGNASNDTYLSGAVVERLEKRFAEVLGKERAVFVPTGTLANHLAIRNLARGKSRVLVQAESHIYRDSLDCVQSLSSVNLVPLAEGQATFTLTQVEDACKRATDGPFPVPVGAISIESPVRRTRGQVFDYTEMKRITGYARERAIGLHLDGARLFIASAYTGVAPIEYAGLFDTVYISLYKYFNAATGAILAGSRDLIERVAHDRKLFGSGLYQGWPYAAMALHHLDGFRDRFQSAVDVSKSLFASLGKHPRFRIDALPQGTNIFKFEVEHPDLDQYQAALKRHGILVRKPEQGPDFRGFWLTVNESLNRRPVEGLVAAFIRSLAE
jgi:threonine aldolase